MACIMLRLVAPMGASVPRASGAYAAKEEHNFDRPTHPEAVEAAAVYKLITLPGATPPMHSGQAPRHGANGTA